MNRFKKWLTAIIVILLLPLPLYALSTTTIVQQQLQLSLTKDNMWDDIIQWYVIIGSIIVLCYLAVMLVTVLFWPTRRKFNLLSKKTGHVTVTSKAINGFVHSSLAQEPYLTNVKVSSRLTNRSIKIKINGNLLAGADAKQAFDQYLDELAVNLRKMLGIDQKPKINIKFANYQSTKKPRSKRVQ